MKTIKRLGSIAIAFALLGTLASAASKTQRTNKYFTVAGTVLEINERARTLLVAERQSEKLYLIAVPEGVNFKISFGRYMRMAEPGFNDVNIGERVEIRCKRTGTEHLATLQDGRKVFVLTAAH